MWKTRILRNGVTHFQTNKSATAATSQGANAVDELRKQLAAIDAKLDAIADSDAPETQKAEYDRLMGERATCKASLDAKIKAKADKEARKAEQAAMDKQTAEIEAAKAARLAAEEEANRLELRQRRQTNAGSPNTGQLPAEAIDHAVTQRLGFQSFGEFAREIRLAGMQKAPTPRLVQTYGDSRYTAVIGMNEGIASEGGALIPPQFMQTIMARINAGTSLLPRTDQYTIPADTMTWPRNLETSRATGSRYGGIQTYWRGEGAAPTAKFPKFGKFTLNLHKLISLAGVTDELLRDANSSVLEQYLNAAFSEDMAFEIDAAIVAGTGAGQPSGLKDAACAVSVTKETNQAAATIVPANIVKMWSRLWAGCRANAVWLINQDTEPQLNLMSFGLGTAGVMLYMPPGGLSSAPYATLMGRPVIAIEQCETLGTKGDIILTDLKHYITASNGGPVAATSAHLYFDTDQMAFRLTFRVDGANWWAAPLTPFKGTATQSCTVTLATRA